MARTSAVRPRLHPLDDRLVPAVLFVDDDRQQRPSAGYTSIQAAVDAAAPGDTVRVFPGTYREQVVIEKRLELDSVARGRAVIRPPAGGLSDTGVLVDVAGSAARGVVVDGFAVRGPGAAAGISVFDGASATIRNNEVTDITDDPPSGSQTGVGIEVQGADAVVVGNTVSRYQKSGIVAFGPGRVTIRGNTVAGAGPTALIAQNGIQVSDGATGSVVGNRVSGNSYTGPGDAEATGILVVGAGALRVADNKLTGNEIGLAVQGQTAGLLADGNSVRQSLTDGIRVIASRGVRVLDNRVSDSGQFGISLTEGTTSTLVAFNRVSGSGVRDLSDDGVGNLFLFNG